MLSKSATFLLTVIIIRTLLLLHIMDMILEMNIGPRPASGCSQLNQILLPCSQALWEAEKSSTWEAEYMKYLNTRKMSEMLKCGHLRRMEESDLNSVESEMEEDLLAWSKGTDKLGALLLMGMQRQLY
jgi:hypothetical protein